jgi:hypothetical protein
MGNLAIGKSKAQKFIPSVSSFFLLETSYEGPRIGEKEGQIAIFLVNIALGQTPYSYERAIFAPKKCCVARYATVQLQNGSGFGQLERQVN